MTTPSEAGRELNRIRNAKLTPAERKAIATHAGAAGGRKKAENARKKKITP